MPVFVSLTGHMTLEEKNKTAATANIAVAIILIIALLAGQMLLDLFSISLDSFRVAGGLLLLSIAFSMMSGKLGEDKQNKQENPNTSAVSKLRLSHWRCHSWPAPEPSVQRLFMAHVIQICWIPWGSF